jgi:hypothetical protein
MNHPPLFIALHRIHYNPALCDDKRKCDLPHVILNYPDYDLICGSFIVEKARKYGMNFIKCRLVWKKDGPRRRARPHPTNQMLLWEAGA